MLQSFQGAIAGIELVSDKLLQRFIAIAMWVLNKGVFTYPYRILLCMYMFIR